MRGSQSAYVQGLPVSGERGLQSGNRSNDSMKASRRRRNADKTDEHGARIGAELRAGSIEVGRQALVLKRPHGRANVTANRLIPQDRPEESEPARSPRKAGNRSHVVQLWCVRTPIHGYLPRGLHHHSYANNILWFRG